MNDFVYIKDTGITAPAGSVMSATRAKMTIEYEVSAVKGILMLMHKPRLHLKTTVKILGAGHAVDLPIQVIDLVGVEGVPLADSSLVAELDEADQSKLNKMTSRAALRYRNLVRAERAVNPTALASTDPALADKAFKAADDNRRAKEVAFNTIVGRISKFIGENETVFGAAVPEAEDEDTEAETGVEGAEPDDFGTLTEVLTQLEEAGLLTDGMYASIERSVRERALEIMEPLSSTSYAPHPDSDEEDEDDWVDDEDDEDEGGKLEDDEGGEPEDGGDGSDLNDAAEAALAENAAEAAAESPRAPRILHPVPPTNPT